MIRLPLLAFAVVSLLASAGPAFAHAELATSSPAAGAVVQTPPTEVSISFTEEVEPLFSGIEVQDAEGNRVDQGETHAAPGDAKRLIVGLGTLSPGAYKVIWHNTSIDSHKEEGSFEFTYKP
jgi:copper resistance protein C